MKTKKTESATPMVSTKWTLKCLEHMLISECIDADFSNCNAIITKLAEVTEHFNNIIESKKLDRIAELENELKCLKGE